MTPNTFASLLTTLLVTAATATAQAPAAPPPAPPADGAPAAAAKIGEKAPDFTLTGADGKTYKLSDFAGKLVVLQWISPGCPVCRGVMEDGRVGKMIESVKSQFPEAVFLMINSTFATRDKPQETAEYLAQHKITSPALIDGEGKVGHLYGARTTPALYVIDPAGILRYSGALDNDEDGEKSGSSDGPTNYVAAAVTAIKEGKEVSPSKTKSYGCGVKYERARRPKQ